MSRSLRNNLQAAAVAVLAGSHAVLANNFGPRAACANTLTPSYTAPVVADGWEAQLVVQGLTIPRTLVFDDQGAMLVVEYMTGLARITFEDNGGTCLVATSTTLLNQTDLTYGLVLSQDGKTLYASSAESVYAWSYDSATGVLGSDRTVIVNNMTNEDHTTRTLALFDSNPTQLLVSRGSAGNIDEGTRELDSGRSQIRVFDLEAVPSGRPYNYNAEGLVLGWGLRNDMGIAEEPLTKKIYTVEMSVDDLARDGVDIHNNNPGEKMNCLAPLSEALKADASATPPNYGYPQCVAVWNTTGVPDLPAEGLSVGSHIALNKTAGDTDEYCATNTIIPPRLTFQAHEAPLAIYFKPDGSAAYVSFHGSWDRDVPVGYRLAQIDFANGEPVAASTSTTSTTNIMSNQDNTVCPNGCFRPAGLVMDKSGRLFMASDTTGEIYVLRETS